MPITMMKSALLFLFLGIYQIVTATPLDASHVQHASPETVDLNVTGETYTATTTTTTTAGLADMAIRGSSSSSSDPVLTAARVSDWYYDCPVAKTQTKRFKWRVDAQQHAQKATVYGLENIDRFYNLAFIGGGKYMTANFVHGHCARVGNSLCRYKWAARTEGKVFVDPTPRLILNLMAGGGETKEEPTIEEQCGPIHGPIPRDNCPSGAMGPVKQCNLRRTHTDEL